MQTVISKRSVVIAGRKTSVSLEDAFWNSMKDIGRSQGVTLSELVDDIDTRRVKGNLSSAIRLFVLAHYRGQTSGASAGAGMQASNGARRPQDNGSGTMGGQAE